jgi:biopolymer transport protein ExbD
MELSGGRVVLNGQPVPRKELEALLRSIFAGRPSGVLFLLVAPGANRREASILIGVAKRSGVHRVALVPAATGQPVAP